MRELDVKDRKILAVLSTDARASYAEIGREVQLHKDTVAYRIGRLEEDDVISGYTIFYDFSKLGISVYKLYINFTGLSEEEREAIRVQLRDKTKVGWIAEGNGMWDLIIGVHAGNNEEFYNFKFDLEDEYHDRINEITTTSHVQAHFHPRSYLHKTEGDHMKCFSYEEPVELDELDRDILKTLARNARMPTVEIGAEVGSTARKVSYRINRMEDEGVILQYRTAVNLNRFGHSFLKAFITLRCAADDKQHMLRYLKDSPNIVHNVECIGAWDLEPEFEVQDVEQFYTILNEFRSRFAEHIAKVDSMIINREHKYQYVPTT